MIFIEEIHIEASAETIFSIYKDVNNWSVWDPEIKSHLLMVSSSLEQLDI